VECKEICVPRVVFPWQNPHAKHHSHHGHGCRGCDSCADGRCGGANCCDACRCNNGACVRTVKVLKKHKYTCPSCKYSWTPVKCGDGGACCDPGCAAAPVMMEGQDPEPALAPPSDVPPAPPEPSADQSASSSLPKQYKKRIAAIFSSRTKVVRDKR
jgi:hypothetical protein